MKTYEINGVHYYFDKKKFSKQIQGYWDKKKAENTPCHIKDVYSDLAEKCSTTWDNVKRWRMGNHGPGDLEKQAPYTFRVYGANVSSLLILLLIISHFNYSPQ